MPVSLPAAGWLDSELLCPTVHALAALVILYLSRFAPTNNTMATTLCLHISPYVVLLGSAPTHRPPAHRLNQPMHCCC